MQSFFGVFSFGYIPGNGNVDVFPVDGQTEGTDLNRELGSIFSNIGRLKNGIAVCVKADFQLAIVIRILVVADIKWSF